MVRALGAEGATEDLGEGTKAEAPTKASASTTAAFIVDGAAGAEGGRVDSEHVPSGDLFAVRKFRGLLPCSTTMM